MASKKGGKKLQQGSPRNALPQSTGSGPTGGRGSYGAVSDGLARFSRRFFPILLFAFISLTVAVAWILYLPQLKAVVIAVVLLVVMLGGLFWLVLFVRKRSDELEDDPPINETHDRRGYPGMQQEEFGSSLITQDPLLQARGSNEKVPPPQDLGNVKDAAFNVLVKRVSEIETIAKGVDARLTSLEHELYYPRNPKPMEETRPVAAAPASSTPKRPMQDYNAYREPQPRPSAIDLSSLSQAICRFLADQTGSWEIDRLVQAVRGSMDGNTSIDVEHLGSHSSGEWRLVVLWPQRSQEGLIVVSSGELVDDDIAKYFDVGYGRRIISCKQPARVARGGSEITVLQKGRVENS